MVGCGDCRVGSRSKGVEGRRAVKERPELIAAGDLELWAHLIAEQRALLTENVADFMPLARQGAAAGQGHGVILCDARSMPRSQNTIGLYVDRLDELLASHRAADALLGQWIWLG